MNNKILYIIIIILSVSLAYIGFANFKNNIYLNSILSKYGVNKESISKKVVVPDEQTAIKIAEAVLYPIYGIDIDESKPLKAKLDENLGVWKVEGTLPNVDDTQDTLGGVPYVLIQKKDGKVLAIWHTK